MFRCDRTTPLGKPVLPEVYRMAAMSASMRAWVRLPGTAISALLKQGAWSAATSGLASLGDVWGFGLAFAYEGTDLGDSGDHSITFAKVVPTSVDFAEGSPSTLSVTADVYGAIGGDITLTSP